MIDVPLLREQIEFLDSYPWREPTDQHFIEGVIHLLESILDKELDKWLNGQTEA